MTWVKLDDAFFEHPKIANLSKDAALAFLESICYSSRNLTDGFIPLKKAKEFAGRPKVIAELVPSLWEVAEGGFLIHDYLQYQRSKAQALGEQQEKHGAKVRGGQARAASASRNSGRFTSTTTSTTTSTAPAQPPAQPPADDQHVTSSDPDPDPDQTKPSKNSLEVSTSPKAVLADAQETRRERASRELRDILGPEEADKRIAESQKREKVARTAFFASAESEFQRSRAPPA